MAIKIQKKIISYNVVGEEDKAKAAQAAAEVAAQPQKTADVVQLGEPLSRLCFDGPEDQLTLTENQQPAILAVSIAAYRLLESRGVQAAFVAGHSLGEYSANVAAGTMTFADAVRTVRRRGRYMQDAVPVGTGAMAAILGLDEALVFQACAEAAQGEVVSPANMNVPTYLGASIELGNVWQQRSDAGVGSALKNGSLFLGLDTLLGPVYLAGGYDSSGQTAFYLFLGRIF